MRSTEEEGGREGGRCMGEISWFHHWGHEQNNFHIKSLQKLLVQCILLYFLLCVNEIYLYIRGGGGWALEGYQGTMFIHKETKIFFIFTGNGLSGNAIKVGKYI